MFAPIYKLQSWIDEKIMYPNYLSENTKRISLVLQHGNVIDWTLLTKNPNYIYYLNPTAIQHH